MIADNFGYYLVTYPYLGYQPNFKTYILHGHSSLSHKG